MVIGAPPWPTLERGYFLGSLGGVGSELPEVVRKRGAIHKIASLPLGRMIGIY